MQNPVFCPLKNLKVLAQEGPKILGHSRPSTNFFPSTFALKLRAVDQWIQKCLEKKDFLKIPQKSQTPAAFYLD